MLPSVFILANCKSIASVTSMPMTARSSRTPTKATPGLAVPGQVVGEGADGLPYALDGASAQGFLEFNPFPFAFPKELDQGWVIWGGHHVFLLLEFIRRTGGCGGL